MSRAIEIESRPTYHGASNTSVLRVSAPNPHAPGFQPLRDYALVSVHTGGASVVAYFSADDCRRIAAAMTAAADALALQKVAA